jgi:hypothetical protein
MNNLMRRVEALERRRDAGRPLFVSAVEASDIRSRLWSKLGLQIPPDMPPCRGYRLGRPQEHAALTLRVLEKMKAFVREGEERFPHLALDATKASLAERFRAVWAPAQNP